MRVSFLAIGAGLILASMPVASDAQRADNDILPRSVALQHQGAEAQAKGDLAAAVDFYESALAADPRNRSAIVALAQVARAQGLPGKAIGFYREALLLEPNDVVALTGQGEALADKGALELAREKLADAKRELPAGRSARKGDRGGQRKARRRGRGDRAETRRRDGRHQPELIFPKGAGVGFRVGDG